MARKLSTPRLNLRIEIVYVIFDSAPVAAFATLDEAKIFVETQRDPSRYAISRLGVSKLFAAKPSKIEGREALNEFLEGVLSRTDTVHPRGRERAAPKRSKR